MACWFKCSPKLTYTHVLKPREVPKLEGQYHETYIWMQLLSEYSELNFRGFQKVLKKFLKVCGRSSENVHHKETVMNAVKESAFNSSDKLSSLILGIQVMLVHSITVEKHLLIVVITIF